MERLETLKKRIALDLKNAVIVDVLEALTVYSPKGRRVQMRERESYGLSFCTDGGEIVYTQKDKTVTEDKAHAVLLPQGGSYALVGTEDGTFPVINFFALYPLTERITSLPVRNPDYLLSCYEEIRRLSASGGHRAKILSLFYEILSLLTEEEEDGALAPALFYLDAHLGEPSLSNERLAAECKMSEVYFRRLFKKRFGTSPKQYILRLRLQKARQLLSEGKMKIRAVASTCGFENQAHFCRYFKESFGLTPSEYRKKNQIYGI